MDPYSIVAIVALVSVVAIVALSRRVRIQARGLHVETEAARGDTSPDVRGLRLETESHSSDTQGVRS